MILGPDGAPAATGLVGAEAPKLEVHTGALLSIEGVEIPNGPRLIALKFSCMRSLLVVDGNGAHVTWKGRKPKEVMVVIPEPEIEALLQALTKAPESPETSEEVAP